MICPCTALNIARQAFFAHIKMFVMWEKLELP